MIPALKRVNRNGVLGKPALQVLEVGQAGREPVHLLIERTEQQELCDGTLDSATFKLAYQVIPREPTRHQTECGEFSACYRRSYGDQGECVRLTSSSINTGGFVVIDPGWLAGHRLGTYLLNEIVTWAQQWPDAEIMPICTLLSGKPSPGNTNTGRRNPFYEQFGITFDSGISRPMKVSGLNTVDSWQQNIQEIPLEQFLAKALGQIRDQRRELKARDKHLQEIRGDWEFAVLRPVRWTLRRWIERLTQ